MPGLNEQQRDAVNYDSGPVIVLAGPGTGKTRVIVHRVQRLIESGIEPAHILAVTFTVKAAGQLRQRLAELVGPARADRVHARTFHGFAQHLLSRFGDMIGLPPRHLIIDAAQQLHVLRRCAQDLGVLAPYAGEGLENLLAQCRECAERLQHAGLFPGEVERFCEQWLSRLERNQEALDTGALAAERARHSRFLALARLHAAASEERRRRGQFTYEDLILLSIRLLRECEVARTLCRDEFRHVVVDEFQDVNAGQIELLRALCPPDADLCVVGDDDQSIYLFRGADDRAFTKFARHWPAAPTIPLSENYRSEACILASAAATIARAEDRFAPDKRVERAAELRSRPPAPGAAVECVECDDDSRQFGEVIAAVIKTDRAASPARPWSAYAAIATSHLDLSRVEQALRAEGIPCLSSRAPSPLDDPGVQDVLAWVGLIADPANTAHAHRLLVRPPALATPARVTEWLVSFRAQRSRHGLDPGSQPDPGDFTAWLARHHAADPAAARFLRTFDAVRTATLEHPAHRALLEIVRICDAAHADLCPARERAARVSALADLLRFARERAPLLSAPGDLRAFHEYWSQLPDDDQRALQRDDEDRLGPADDDRPDAVSLLTAHKAKGLEFDTVFVVRVSPQHGFGKVRDQGYELPDELEDRAGDTRDPRSRRRAEARRLFYVACTRAQRRLVILAKKKKSRSENDYFQELTGDPAKLVTCRPAAEVFEQAARAGVTLASRGLVLEAGLREGWEDELAKQRAAARAAAADALESVERPGAQPDDLARAADALRSAAARLAVIAHMQQSGEPPEWSGTDPSAAALASALSRSLAQERTPAPPTRPMRPPLKLSYSAVSEYHRCPRCFYLKNVVRLPEPASGAVFVGDLAHRALQAHFTALRRHESEEGPPPMDPAAAARDLYLSSLAPGASADAAMLAQLEAMLAAAGALHRPEDEIAEIEFTLDFPYEHDGVQHSFTAKLDRLDLWPGGGHRIIDYKTGKPSDRFTSPEPRDTQLGVYALALRHHQGIHLSDRDTPARGVAEYWHLPTAARGRIDLAEIDYPYIRTQIDKAISGMLEGRFEPKKGCEGLCTYITL